MGSTLSPEPAEESTLPPTSLSSEALRGVAADALALVVLWSRAEAGREGEALLVPADGSTAPWVFGRGAPASGERRLLLVRQRPGGNEPAGPLACRRISRVQLRLHATAAGGLAIENAGRCALSCNGVEAARVEAAPGDVLELRDELLLLVTLRPPELPASRDAGAPEMHAFGRADRSGMVGESPALWRLRGQIAAAARRALHVLVLGESGSGKELVARAIHAGSARGRRTLVSRNAATIPEGLADAELFGNLRNYPNAGIPERPGLLGQADGSTLFLDEFAELPARLQAHLLRVLDDGEYQRLGEATPRRSDFRFIGATNQSEARIKHDVLARLTIRIAVPGLDARREDIPLMAAELLRRHAAADPALARRFFPEGLATATPRLSPSLVRALVGHRFTTHVRELDALLLRAALESSGRYVDLTAEARLELESAVRPPAEASLGPSPGDDGGFARASGSAGPDPGGLERDERLELLRKHRFRPTDCGRDPAYPGNRQSADLHLRQLICRALQTAGWDVPRAAGLLAGEGDAELARRAEARIETFLENLSRRLGPGPGAELDEARRQAITGEWGASAEAVFRVASALRAGRVRRRPKPGDGS